MKITNNSLPNQKLTELNKQLAQVNLIWEKGITEQERTEGIKKAGFICSPSQADFYIKKAALKALGKIK